MPKDNYILKVKNNTTEAATVTKKMKNARKVYTKLECVEQFNR